MTARLNKIMVFAGVVTLFQAAGQLVFTSLALLQYFCVIDFLVELPLLVFIRILYFHNPSTCGSSINIGQVLAELNNPQALVLFSDVPFTATRTFIINGTGLGLSFLWLLTCIGIMRGGARNKQSKPVRWPWIIVTVAVCAVDLVATVTYANDTFHTRTLTDMMDFIGGVARGTSRQEVNTVWTAWVMVLIYSRFGILFALNLILVVLVIIDGSTKRITESTAVQVEAPYMISTEVNTDQNDVETTRHDGVQMVSAQTNTHTSSIKEDDDDDEISLPSERPTKILPRPGLRQSFRDMKTRLFQQPAAAARSLPNSLDPTPESSPRALYLGIDKKRQVNFPENLLSLPQRLENLIAEQQRRLDKAVIDTAWRRSPPQASQSMPHLAPPPAPQTAPQPSAGRGRRGTAAELQGQLPWAYIPASANRMRDQLPPDEDLPPVPLPDYTAIPSFRKASVHRATSSLSSLTQRKEFKSQLPRPPLTSSDVLY